MRLYDRYKSEARFSWYRICTPSVLEKHPVYSGNRGSIGKITHPNAHRTRYSSAKMISRLKRIAINDYEGYFEPSSEFQFPTSYFDIGPWIFYFQIKIGIHGIIPVENATCMGAVSRILVDLHWLYKTCPECQLPIPVIVIKVHVSHLERCTLDFKYTVDHLAIRLVDISCWLSVHNLVMSPDLDSLSEYLICYRYYGQHQSVD